MAYGENASSCDPLTHRELQYYSNLLVPTNDSKKQTKNKYQDMITQQNSPFITQPPSLGYMRVVTSENELG